MQWDHGPNAGFAPAEARPWLPVQPKYSSTNVATQSRDPSSSLNCYRQLLRLRREERALQAGSLEWLDELQLPTAIVAYRRRCEGNAERSVDVLLNFSRQEIGLDLSAHAGRRLFSSRRCDRRDAPKIYNLAAHEGVVIFDRE
jgi:alpha-glucosidase